jgi:arylsulfate sulfotransferase
MRNQSWILKIDYENGTGTGEILWRLGEGGDFQIVGGGPSRWFFGQHDPNLVLDNGSQLTLAIWDNGNFRIDSSGQAYGGTIACYGRATIFQVDQTARVANVVWQDRPGPYDFWGGSIAVLPNGNVEFDQTSLFGFVPASRIVLAHVSSVAQDRLTVSDCQI